MPEPGRAPAEDGSVLAAADTPTELTGERPPCPAPGRCLLTGTTGHLGGRHPAETSCVPADLGSRGNPHTRSTRPLSRLSPTAIVARVVDSRESRLIGIGPPVLTASTNASISERWPLS
jgi:hypothetical protein